MVRNSLVIAQIKETFWNAIILVLSHAVVLTITCAAIPVEASRALTGKLTFLSRLASGVGVTAVSSSETWILLLVPSWDSTVYFRASVTTMFVQLILPSVTARKHREPIFTEASVWLSLNWKWTFHAVFPVKIASVNRVYTSSYVPSQDVMHYNLGRMWVKTKTGSQK